MQLLFLFMMYSLIGWLWETPFVSIKEKKLINRGFLTGPYIPIYGASFVSIVLLLNYLNAYINFASIQGILLQVFSIAIITAIWEYITSYLLEKIFNARWWDYSYKKYNINGRVALSSTLFFGIGGFLLYNFVNPVLVDFYYNISTNLLIYGFTVFYVIFLTDSVVTLIQMFNLKSLVKALSKIQDTFSERYILLLNKANRFKRFFKKYPKSYSRKFKPTFADIKKKLFNKNKGQK